MKKILFTLTLSLFTIISFAQAPTFTLSEEKPTFPNQYVVIEVNELTIDDSYKKIIDWINITYDDPSQIIKAQLEHKYIRIQSESKDITHSNTLMRYLIQFRFEEKIVIIDIVELDIYTVTSSKSLKFGDTGNWSSISLKNKKMYKKNGKFKKAYSSNALKIMSYFNELVLSIDTHIKQ